MEEIRLQKYLADCGIASRRKSEELIKQGQVKVNGKTITELGTKVIPNKDIVKYNGKKIELKKEYVYITFNLRNLLKSCIFLNTFFLKLFSLFV